MRELRHHLNVNVCSQTEAKDNSTVSGDTDEGFDAKTTTTMLHMLHRLLHCYAASTRSAPVAMYLKMLSEGNDDDDDSDIEDNGDRQEEECESVYVQVRNCNTATYWLNRFVIFLAIVCRV